MLSSSQTSWGIPISTQPVTSYEVLSAFRKRDEARGAREIDYQSTHNSCIFVLSPVILVKGNVYRSVRDISGQCQLHNCFHETEPFLLFLKWTSSLINSLLCLSPLSPATLSLDDAQLPLCRYLFLNTSSSSHSPFSPFTVFAFEKLAQDLSLTTTGNTISKHHIWDAEIPVLWTAARYKVFGEGLLPGAATSLVRKRGTRYVGVRRVTGSGGRGSLVQEGNLVWRVALWPPRVNAPLFQ